MDSERFNDHQDDEVLDNRIVTASNAIGTQKYRSSYLLHTVYTLLK